ncbi:hypothetical protein HDU81_003556 [Chytriomyces hyalinus]|nr:hypothetical protein HDU81_003556 [Chytriomyces hyalinus]
MATAITIDIQDPTDLIAVFDSIEGIEAEIRECLETVSQQLSEERETASLLVEISRFDGVADTSRTSDSAAELRLSAQYLSLDRHDSIERLRHETRGVLVHELVHVLQFDGHGTAPHGWIEGFADLVRLRADLAPPHWDRNSVPESWDQGYESTAYFLEWIEETTPHFTNFVNTLLRTEPWSLQFFETFTTKSVHLLWSEYLSSKLAPPPPQIQTQPVYDAEGYSIPEFQFSNQTTNNSQQLQSLYPSIHHILSMLNDRSSAVQRVLYSTPETMPTDVRRIQVILSDMSGVAHTLRRPGTSEIHMSASYLEGVWEKNHGNAQFLKDEIEGVLSHELVHVWQKKCAKDMSGGFLEGVADWVRMRVAFSAKHWKRDIQNGQKWDAGYEKTAYFMDFVDGLACERNGWMAGEGVRRMNQVVGTLDVWDAERVFAPMMEGLEGMTVDLLWKLYVEEVASGKNETSKGNGDLVEQLRLLLVLAEAHADDAEFLNSMDARVGPSVRAYLKDLQSEMAAASPTLSALTPLGRGALAAVGVAEAVVVFAHAAWQRKRARVVAKAAALLAVLLCMRRSTWARVAFARGLYYAALAVGGPSFKAVALQKQQQPTIPTKVTQPRPAPKSHPQLPPQPALTNKIKPTPISTPTPSLIEAPRFSPSSQPGSPISDMVDFDAGDDYFVDALDIGSSLKSAQSLARVQPLPNAAVEPNLQDLFKLAFTLETVPANQNKQLATLHLSAPESQTAHTFSDPLDKALIQFMHLEHTFSKKEATTLAEWTLEATRDNVTIHTHPVAQDSAFSVVRGCGELPAGFTVAECLSVIRSTACRKTWDARYDSGTVLQVLGVDDGVAHTIQKGSFPVAARDMIVAVTTRRVSRHEAVFVATSVTDGDAFPKAGASGRVRADLTFAGWMLRVIGGKAVEAVYMVQVDPKGTIPSSIVKLVQTQTPLAIARVSEYLTKHGPVPFIIQVPSDDAYSVFVNPASTMNALFRGETWDPTTSVYTCSMDVDSAETAFSIAIPKGSYGGNASCTVSVLFKWLPDEGEQVPPVAPPRVKGSILVGLGVAPEVDAERRRTWLKAVVGDATGAVLRVHVAGSGVAAGSGVGAGMWRMEVKIAKHSIGTGIFMDGEKVSAFV